MATIDDARMNRLLLRIEALVATTMTVLEAHMDVIKKDIKADDAFREYVLSRLEELQRGQR